MYGRILATLTLILLVCTPAAGQQAAAAPRVKLAELEAEAERNHPAILAAEKMAEAKRARVAQARALPDPQVSLGYMGDPAPFKTQAGDPSSFRQLGVMQEFPYPGKRDLRGRVAGKDAAAELWNAELARRRILSELRQAYYEMWAVDRAIEITGQSKSLLEKLARIAEEKYKVGQGLQQDVLRAQVEVTRILPRLTLLRQRRRALEAKIDSLLRRPTDTPMGAPEPLQKADLTVSLDELVARARAEYPEVHRQDEFIEQGRLAENLARKAFYPDFGVGWDYINRPGMPEMYGLRFTVNIPIFNREKRRAAVREAVAMQASAEKMREAVQWELAYRVRQEYLAARAAEELVLVYSKGIVPQSRLTLEASLAAYQTGKLDFLNVIASFTTVLDYELNYYEELAKYQQALARLEEITGIRLTAPAAPDAAGK
jgi:cobalt-zinc-cadmium efflux system outer membrane protein